jgi:hypothetical protein
LTTNFIVKFQKEKIYCIVFFKPFQIKKYFHEFFIFIGNCILNFFFKLKKKKSWTHTGAPEHAVRTHLRLEVRAHNLHVVESEAGVHRDRKVAGQVDVPLQADQLLHVGVTEK